MKFFFMALALSNGDSLFEDLKKYCDQDGRVVLAGETAKGSHPETNGEHFHIAIDMNDNSYKAFYKTIIQTKYGLKGRATKNGTGRQYGLIKPDKVRDETKFLSYTVKSKNLRTQNISPEELKKYIDESFIKEDKKSKIDLLMDYLIGIEHEFYVMPNGKAPKGSLQAVPIIDIRALEFNIFKWFMNVWGKTKQEVPTSNQVKSLGLRFLMFHSLTNYELKDSQIFTYLRYNQTM